MRPTDLLLIGSNLWIFAFICGVGTSSTGKPPRDEEYCHYEKFNPKCNHGEVLVIHRASYGRMAIGRCVKTNFGFVGCFTDVLRVVDRNCSGRRACTMDVVDPSFGATVPCNNEFKNYFQVSYNCVKVPNIDEATCRLVLDERADQVIPVGGGLHTAPCGTITRPLRVEAKQGQRINMTLLDFNPRQSKTALSNDRPSSAEVIDMPPVCHRYGLVFDGEPSDKSLGHFRSEGRDICRAEVRESLVMSSTSSVLLLQFSPEKTSNFALRFTVVGCPKLAAPRAGWVDQDQAQARLGCTSTKRVSNVVCQGNQWVGDIVNCTKAYTGRNKPPEKGGFTNTVFTLSSAWTSLVALGVAIIIGLVILIVGLFCWRRMKRNERGSTRTHMTDNTAMYQVAATQSIDASDAELDLIAEQQRTPCLYCRAASEHYAPFREVDKATILPRQTLFSGSRTLDRSTVMPPDIYSCNVKNADEDERIKILSDLNVAYDRLPQTLPMRGQSEGPHSVAKAKDREHKVLNDI